jgi:hypothetical protein
MSGIASRAAFETTLAVGATDALPTGAVAARVEQAHDGD